MNFLSLLERKREGFSFSDEEIYWIIRAYTAREIPDYQMAALLMAICFRPLTDRETRAWTFAMRDSGEKLSFPADSRPLVDKHSTGGVGDKVSLILAPLLACLGFRVPMMSGRGLGITGGTLDKLESIPGFRTRLTVDEIVRQVQDIGCVICSQTDQMVPADKAMYALRDATVTVASIPLITASIMSKKLAEGIDALLLDVKFGSAAFMKTRQQAMELAHSMVQLGNDAGVHTRALLSDMNTPLGRNVGNWLEVKEAVSCLRGDGPGDLQELVIECAASLLVQTEFSETLQEARPRATECLQSGKPLKKWDAMLAAQGSDLGAYDQKLSAKTRPVLEISSSAEGFVRSCDAQILGEIVRDLGGGRLHKDALIDESAGLEHLAKPGDKISRGSLLCRVYGQRPVSKLEERLRSAFLISEQSPSTSAIIFPV